MSKLVDWHLTIPGLELKSSNHDLRGTTRQGMFGRSARAKKQRDMACLACRGRFGKAPVPPLVITITRIGPRELDSDNLAGSAKHVRDGIADWLGINDRDKRLQWRYEQEKQGKGVYGVRIRVQTWTQTFAEYLLGHNEYQTVHNTCLKLASVWMDWVNHDVRPPSPAMIRAKKSWDRWAAKRDKLTEDLRKEWEAQNGIV